VPFVGFGFRGKSSGSFGESFRVYLERVYGLFGEILWLIYYLNAEIRALRRLLGQHIRRNTPTHLEIPYRRVLLIMRVWGIHCYFLS